MFRSPIAVAPSPSETLQRLTSSNPCARAESPRQLRGKPTARAGLLHPAKSRVRPRLAGDSAQHERVHAVSGHGLRSVGRFPRAWLGFELSFSSVAPCVSPPLRASPEVGVGSQPAQGDYCWDWSSQPVFYSLFDSQTSPANGRAAPVTPESGPPLARLACRATIRCAHRFDHIGHSTQ